jgi:RNA polymerase sigma-70 factor (ECF subfamily)
MTGSESPWTRAIVEQNQRWLTAYFLSATGDRSVSEDLVQEVFHQALESQDNYDATKPFGAWLRGIARHLLFRHYRNSRHAMLPFDGAMLDQLDLVSSQAEVRLIDPDYQPTRLAALRLCMERLSARARSLLDLKYAERQSSKAIAERVGMKTNAVDMVISRARRTLEACVGRRLASDAPAAGGGDD